MHRPCFMLCTRCCMHHDGRCALCCWPSTFPGPVQRHHRTYHTEAVAQRGVLSIRLGGAGQQVDCSTVQRSTARAGRCHGWGVGVARTSSVRWQPCPQGSSIGHTADATHPGSRTAVQGAAAPPPPACSAAAAPPPPPLPRPAPPHPCSAAWAACPAPSPSAPCCCSTVLWGWEWGGRFEQLVALNIGYGCTLATCFGRMHQDPLSAPHSLPSLNPHPYNRLCRHGWVHGCSCRTRRSHTAGRWSLAQRSGASTPS